MYYYMITEGLSQIEKIFFGVTKEEVVDEARKMINQWPEYAALDNEEIIELAEAGETEFDLVKIKGSLPAVSVSIEELVTIYNDQWGG